MRAAAPHRRVAFDLFGATLAGFGQGLHSVELTLTSAWWHRPRHNVPNPGGSRAKYLVELDSCLLPGISYYTKHLLRGIDAIHTVVARPREISWCAFIVGLWTERKL